MSDFRLARLLLPNRIGPQSQSEARLVRAVRLWVVLNKQGRGHVGAVAQQLGSRESALALDLLMMRVGIAWTEAFVVNPPCCPRFTHDEALILDMVAMGAIDDRQGFDRLLSEMLPCDAREALFHSARQLGARIAAAVS
ncbi:hypothetical protein [Allosphingosinicella vermicomposti]|uniref:hypothetical protein n=1 Tax=Allosphingosinicella vermicomposti TaxID=614671 RepID=UPI00131A5DD5|nr:hypothetical protein [Allosphingosinicella vermicomposti]